jgi:hypothetical protein
VRFAVDTWAPDYGSSREQLLTPSDRPIDVDVEVAARRWAAIDPLRAGAARVPDEVSVWFVDGVRRIDSRIWIADPDGGLDHPGVCASVAAGAVSCRLHGDRGQARVEQVAVERALFSAIEAEGIELGGSVGFGHYEARTLDLTATADGADGAEHSDGSSIEEALYLAVHQHMTELENRLAEDLRDVVLSGSSGSSGSSDGPTGPIVFDGPLGARTGAAAVGYVKTQHVQYLRDPELQQVLADLPEGHRTPLFHLGGRLANWSWFLRLPGPRSHSLSGIVRLELPGLGSVDDAVDRADEVSALLPRFASEAHKDTRAPQNLYPIAGLERELRRRLGDGQLLDRALRQAAAAASV